MKIHSVKELLQAARDGEGLCPSCGELGEVPEGIRPLPVCEVCWQEELVPVGKVLDLLKFIDIEGELE